MNLPPVADAVAIPVIPVAELPHEAPMPMPVQDLGRGELSGRELATTPRTIHVRRLATIGGAGVLTLVAAYQIWWLLRGGGIDVLEAVLLVLFTLLFAWIALAFTTAAAGFMLAMRGGRMRLGIDPADPLPSLHVRTALLMPIYNEDPTRVMTGLQAIHESVAATGRGAHFDVFVLSDTRNPAIQAAERAAFSRLRASVGAAPRVFYRLRDDNHERKAGNIAEWVRRFGADYPQMLILDADSLMTGDTIVRLAAAMDAHDDVALIQTLPVIVNGNTLFARMQQFAGRVYGPVAAHGIAWWHGAESNYWGHNAIIRTSSFAAHAGLPPIRGYKPFGGAVLSHDFVEAALMRRGGWALHMVPGLSGSYEEGPPSLTDMMIRDRRWCQGNLQHGAVLPARGLHWVSRMHMMVGIGHYFTAPMWAMLMLVGLAIPLQAAGILDGPLPLDGFSPVGYWRAQDPDRFFYVFLLTMALLFGPKLLGFTAMLLDRGFRHACGGGLRATLSLLLESVLAALMAPITMYVQSRGVAQVLAGKDSGWESQRRDDGTLPLSSLVRLYGGLTVFGAFMGVVAYLVSPGLAAWMAPVTVGMVLSIPIVAWTSSRGAGLWLRRHRIFATPEERDPPQVLQRAAELRAGAGAG